MSIVKLLREEFQLWQAWWRQIEAFIERIDDARDADAEYRRKFLALLDVVTAIEDEKRIRNGTGLGAPLEIALRRGEPETSKLHLNGTKDNPPLAWTRVPGAYDVEIAVAPLDVPVKNELVGEDLTIVRFAPNDPPLFERYDERDMQWTPVAVPSYDFGQFTFAGPVDPLVLPYARGGLYDPEIRRFRSLFPPFPPPAPPLILAPSWSSCMAGRAPRTDRAHLLGAVNPQAYPDGVPEGGSNVVGIAMAAKSICEHGAAMLEAAAGALKDDEFPELDDDAAASFLSKIKQTAGDFRARADVYSDFAAGVQVPTAPAITSLHDLGYGLYQPLRTVLDEAVDRRVADPDGTVRALRALEWAFNGFWYVRLAWFQARRRRRLDPLLLRRFLRTFLSSFATAYGGQATGLPFQSSLAKPAFVTSTNLHLSGGASGLDDIKPGMIAVIGGDRKTIAVILGEDPGPAGMPRLRVLPLQVSMAAGSKLPGVAGMISTGLVSAGPVDLSLLTAANLRGGRVHGHPEHDGLPQELAAHWSRLCLILGWKTVFDRIKSARPDITGDFPTYLPRTLRLPVLGPVQPGANRLLLDAGALRAKGFDLDSPARPIIARPGEMLLLRGKEKGGDVWQGAVEVMTITRTTPDKAHEEVPTPPPGQPIGCQEPGEVVVIQVKSTSFPMPLLSDIRLHRDFQGFGAPSLAVGTLLPKEVDPDSQGGDKSLYRGPELRAAREVLQQWMWTRA